MQKFLHEKALIEDIEQYPSLQKVFLLIPCIMISRAGVPQEEITLYSGVNHDRVRFPSGIFLSLESITVYFPKCMFDKRSSCQ